MLLNGEGNGDGSNVCYHTKEFTQIRTHAHNLSPGSCKRAKMNARR